MTPHIESKIEDISNIVLMPGDPLRAKYIAEVYLTDYKLVNSVRNMLAYTGTYKGKKITVFASGMGIPSIGIYSYELFKFYNVDTIIRIGSCGSYQKDINVYDVILVDKAYSKTNYDDAEGVMDNLFKEATSDINTVINETAKNLNINLKRGTIHTKETFYDDNHYLDLVNRYNLLGVEMEAFALFHNAKLLNKKASCVLTVSDNLITGEEITSEQREKSFNQMIELTLEASLNL